MIHQTTCPTCGGPTRLAFDTTTNYVSCRRCGAVHPNRPAAERPAAAASDPSHILRAAQEAEAAGDDELAARLRGMAGA